MVQVYTDFVTGEEFFSDASDVVPVKIGDKESGLVKVKAEKTTEGGGKVDVGGGNAFGGGGAEEDAGDVAETKWGLFWQFPSIENEHKFSSFKEFKDAIFMPLMLAFKKHAVSKGLCKDKDEIKAKGTAMATVGLKWIQDNFKDIEFYSVESTVIGASSTPHTLTSWLT